MIDLDALLELESNATDAPWDINADLNEEDKELVDTMRNSIRELCLELKAARKVVEAARQVVHRYSMMPDNAPSLGVMELEKQLKELEGKK